MSSHDVHEEAHGQAGASLDEETIVARLHSQNRLLLTHVSERHKGRTSVAGKTEDEDGSGGMMLDSSTSAATVNADAEKSALALVGDACNVATHQTSREPGTTEDLLKHALRVQKQFEEAMEPNNDKETTKRAKMARTPSDVMPNRHGPLVSGTAVQSHPAIDAVPSPGGMTETIHQLSGLAGHPKHRWPEENDSKVLACHIQPQFMILCMIGFFLILFPVLNSHV